LSIQVKLYGVLKDKLKERSYSAGTPSITSFKDNEINIVLDILKKLYIDGSEIGHIFVNGKYCGSGKRLNEGDRIGLFPKNMALNFIEIAKNNPIYITVKLFADLREYGAPKSIIDLPEGSTLKNLLKKYKISRDKQKLIILLNRKPCYDDNFVLEDKDTVAIFPPLAGG
jgi:molybdopterin converting factor small subunit